MADRERDRADELDELERSFSKVAVALFSSGSVEATLEQVVELAQVTIDGCEAVGVMAVKKGAAITVAASSPLVVELDQLQSGADEGPCLDAALRSTTFYAEDLMDDARWPTFGHAAVPLGVRSVLAYSLSGDRLGALNLYSRLPAAFGATDRAKGQLFATLARLAIDSASDRDVDAKRQTTFVEALHTREVIGQAQGILMERERITAEQAFDLMRRASQHMNLKLRDVADRLVQTGEIPRIPPADS
jgi:hypothetical protein